MEQQKYTIKDFFGIVVLIIIFALIPLGVFLESRQTAFFSKADENVAPKEVKISNISENSLTISWVTKDKQTLGFISYGKNTDLGNSVFDDRDSDIRKERITHHVTLKNLDTQTKYLFKIGSSGSLFDNNGRPFEVTTAPVSSNNLPLTKFSTGKITKQNGVMSDEAIIYLKAENGYLLSTVVRGVDFQIPLNTARNTDLSEYFEFLPDSKVELLIQAGKDGTAHKILNLDANPEEFNVTL